MDKLIGMLLLRRRVGEEVIIGNGEVVLTVLGMKNGVAELGFKAAKNIPINRKEVFEHIKQKGGAIMAQVAITDKGGLVKIIDSEGYKAQEARYNSSLFRKFRNWREDRRIKKALDLQMMRNALKLK